MKIYLYNEPIYDPKTENIIGNEVKEITEEQILAQYFPWWSKKMKEVGREKFIDKQTCVKD